MLLITSRLQTTLSVLEYQTYSSIEEDKRMIVTTAGVTHGLKYLTTTAGMASLDTHIYTQ
jgi:hypothetical protein